MYMYTFVQTPCNPASRLVGRPEVYADGVINDFGTYDFNFTYEYGSSYYSFDIGDVDMRARLGINNFTDERAPISDSSYGFYQDVHRDYGRYYYIDLRIRL